MRKGFAKLVLLLFNGRKENKRNQSSLIMLGCVKLSQFPDDFSTLESHSPETYTRPLSAVLNYPVFVQRLYTGMNIPNRTDFIGHNKYKNTCCFFSYPESETRLRQIEERNCIRRMNK
jgi:hypothetical protein